MFPDTNRSAGRFGDSIETFAPDELAAIARFPDFVHVHVPLRGGAVDETMV
jgi:hypothetical protein